jgi:hypothetical protein
VRIFEALRSEQLGLSPALSAAYGASVRSLVTVITTMVEQVRVLDAEVDRCFGQHPGACRTNRARLVDWPVAGGENRVHGVELSGL